MDAHYRIRNWTTFQHYKHRSPPWIKFHRTLLDDEKFHRLPDRASKLLVLAWLLASEAEGVLPASHEIAWRLRLASTEVHEDMKTLMALGFVEPASGVLAECVQDASDLLDQSRVEAETEAETEEKKKPSVKKKRMLSVEWSPNDRHRELSTSLGLDLKRCVVDFRDHAQATGRLMLDWDAAFRMWLSKARDMNGNRPPHGSEASAVRVELPRSSAPRNPENVEEVRAKWVAEWARSNPERAKKVRQEVEAELREVFGENGVNPDQLSRSAESRYQRKVIVIASIP